MVRILRPNRRANGELLNFYAQVRHLAETKPKMRAYLEVARSLERQLAHVLVDSFVADAVNDPKPTSDIAKASCLGLRTYWRSAFDSTPARTRCHRVH
jgi:hypothetical protein